MRCWCGNPELVPFSPRFRRCPGCDTLVAARPSIPLAGAAAVPSVYGPEYWDSVQKARGHPDILARARADLSERCLHWVRTLLKYKLPPARVLDLGCGPGASVALMRWAGFDASGLELHSELVEFARQTFGIPVLRGPLEAQSIEPGALDAILMMDVLEHLPDPVATLEHCMKLLTADGIVIVQTPGYPAGRSFEDLQAAEDPFLPQTTSYEHLYLFSRRSVRELLGRVGAVAVEFEVPLFAAHDMYLVASRSALRPTAAAEAEARLLAAPGGRMVQALIDVADRARELQGHCDQRLRVIGRLDEVSQHLKMRLALVEEALAVERAARQPPQETRAPDPGGLEPRGVPPEVLSGPLVALAVRLAGGVERGCRGAKARARRVLVRMLGPRLGKLRQHPPRALRIPARYHRRVESPRWPAISIVTPTFNSARFVERTLASVIAQGYDNLQYIVQDGRSTDGTVDVVERHRGSLAGVESVRDRGQTDALNRGFGRATGEILAYLNSDDILLPGALRYVGAYFATHADVDVVYGHRVLIDENDREIGRWVLPPHDGAALVWADYVPQETLFWRRQIWERVGARLDESFQFAMDWDLLLRFRRAGARFVRLPRFLAAFRVHDDQKTMAQLATIGQAEMARLRERELGRPVLQATASRQVRPYLVRHVLWHKLYRLGLLRH